MRLSSRGSGVSGGRGSGGNAGDGGRNGNHGSSNDADTFVKRISEMFMKWKVRPDVVLRGRHENKSKGALSAFWQDYKKVRVDWRARAGMRRDHFELALQHYMRIDGPSRDTCEGRIRYIWETRIRDNSHLGVVDVSCQPAKAKVGKRRPPAQKLEDNDPQRVSQQQLYSMSQQQMQADGGVGGGGFALSGMHAPAGPASGSSKLFGAGGMNIGGGGGGGGGNNGMVGIGGGSDSAVSTPYDGVTPGVSPSGNQAGSRIYSSPGSSGGGGGGAPMMGRRGGSSDGSWAAAGAYARGGAVGVVKGEMGGESPVDDDPLRKRPREAWGVMGDSTGSLGSIGSMTPQISGGAGRARANPGSQLAGAPSGGTGTPGGGKKDRVPNHWWELELTAEGPMLYPTSNCHEWTSDNGIEHRIMEIEFQHGCEVKPPKDRLIKDFTLNWRPNSDIVYVFETEPSGFYSQVLGMYEKQTVTHNGKFLYRQMQAHPWPVRDRGWRSGGAQETQMRSAWLFNDPATGQWMIALDYQAQQCSPIYQYGVPAECARSGTPCMDLSTFTANSLKVKGCKTLIPPLEVLLLSENSVREVCAAVWVGCFTANPLEVAFDLLCRLMSISESHYFPDDSDRYAAEVFDAQRAEILAYFLVGVCEDPADRVVQRENYLAFMEWFVYTLPEVALPVKIWRMYRALHDDDIPFVSFPLSQDKSAFYSHRQAMSGPAVPGRFSFRFSRQPSHVTVDYTVQGRAVEGRPQATVMSYRIRISFIDTQVVMLRIENLLLRGDGQATQGRLLEETSLMQGLGGDSGPGHGVPGGGPGGGSSSHHGGPSGPPGVQGSGDVGLGILERVIAQVDMEENAPSCGRADLRVAVADEGDSYGQGHQAGTGGRGGAQAGNGGAGASGWTDMFQGMTVELAQEQAAQLPGDGSLTHLQLPGGATLAQVQQQERQQGRHPSHQQHHGHHQLRDRQQHHSPRAVGGGRADSYGRRDCQQPQQHYDPSFAYPSGGGRMVPQAVRGNSLGFFDEPPPGQQQQQHHGGAGSGSHVHVPPNNGGILNLEYVEFSSFKELLVFFGRTLTERYDTSREEQETIPSPMYMHNMDD